MPKRYRLTMSDGLSVRLADRLTPRQRVCLDGLLAVFLAATSIPVANRDFHESSPQGFPLSVVGYVAVLATALAVPLRRRIPRCALGLAVITESVLIGFGIRLPVLLAGGFVMYSLAADPWPALSPWVGIGAVVPMVVAGLIALDAQVLEVVILAVLLASGSVLVGWLAGENSRARRTYALDLAARAADRERERARRLAIEERARIARELHDVVAHAMSVISVRSGVARRIGDRRPEEATEALGIIETISRRSLGELRRLVAVLRQSEEPNTEQFGPAPGLADLPELISQIGAAGVGVEVHVEGQARQLPPTEDLSAYRIAQEALTNVVRHSAAATATLSLRYRQGIVEIECIDTGRYLRARPATHPSNGGHGIVGMRERVALFGGEFSAAPTAEGFRVLARLPIAEEAR